MASIPQGFNDGMDGKKRDIEGTSDGIVQKVLRIFKDGFGIASPSKELYSIGAFNDGGVFELSAGWLC